MVTQAGDDTGVSREMSEKTEVYIVCGSVRSTGAREGVCVKCNAAVWPTGGSAERARLEGIPLICLDCFAKLGDFSFAGFIDHGKMLPPGLSEKLFKVIEELLIEKGI
jgi:hypothetical protein